MKKTMILILAIILSLSLIPISSSCMLKPTFEDIIISSGVEEDTYEPLDTKTEFEASAENIYATIKFSNVKGDDNFRFKWTNLDTGGIVVDYEDQYAKDQKGKYISSVAWTKISSQDFQLKIIPSGDYRVDFYNNGEVVKTTTFKITKPQAKIIEVSLANQVDENYAPVSKTQKFNSNETVYACVKFDIQTIGTNVKAQWKSNTDELLWEDNIDLAEYSSPSYITFWFPPETEVLTAGSYKVEIYLNDSLYGSYDFKVTEEVAETTVTFDQGNGYSSTDFGFIITIPDNWTYKENKAGGEVALTIVPPSQNIQVWSQFSSVNPSPYSPYETYADNDSAGYAEQQGWTFIEKGKNDAVLENGTPCKEYYYSYTDDNNNKWLINYCFAENSGRLYLFIVITDENSSAIALDAYVGILNSLIFY